MFFYRRMKQIVDEAFKNQLVQIERMKWMVYEFDRREDTIKELYRQVKRNGEELAKLEKKIAEIGARITDHEVWSETRRKNNDQ